MAVELVNGSRKSPPTDDGISVKKTIFIASDVRSDNHCVAERSSAHLPRNALSAGSSCYANVVPTCPSVRLSVTRRYHVVI